VAKTSKKPVVKKKSPVVKGASSKKASPKPAPKPTKKVGAKTPVKGKPAAKGKTLMSARSLPKPATKASAAVSSKKPNPASKPAVIASSPAKTKTAPLVVSPAKTPTPAPVVSKVVAPVKSAPATGKSKADSSKTPLAQRTDVIIAEPRHKSSNGAVVAAVVAKPKKALSAKAARRAARAALPPIPVNPVTAIMATVKPGKNGAGLSPKELEFFRELLLAKRRELVGDMYSMEREALQRSGENLSNLPVHMADMGTDNYEQEFTLGLMEKDRQLLREINNALQKIQDGRYGLCEGTGKVIAKARLEVQPWAKFSIEHARKMEMRGVYR